MEPGDVLLFGDECGVQHVPTRKRMWALKGHPPTLLSPGGRKRQSIIGAVAPATGAVTSAFISTLNAMVFLAFLKCIIRVYRHARKIYLVVDNARSHHAKILRSFLKLISWKLELIFLPPYSPDLNPMEDFWKLMREKVTHNTFYEHFNDMIAELRKYLDKCKNPSAEVRSRCNY
ncbi:MAG TPA: IS630 family transposase [Candidatus Lokiarchaeia archaeon]|nr:IS630 family transposase [Candidatus Lokiarchaeia archaeon]